jgi:hypothetical protein
MDTVAAISGNHTHNFFLVLTGTDCIVDVLDSGECSQGSTHRAAQDIPE